MTSTISRTYDHASDATAAIHAVKEIGINTDAISVVANNEHHDVNAIDAAKDDSSATITGAEIGGVVGGGAGLLAGLGLMAIPGVGPLVAAGWLASMAAGVVAGAVAGGATGGIVDVMSEGGIPETEAHAYAEAVRRGSILVSVRVDEGHAVQVRSAMDMHNPSNVAVRKAAWAKDGWKGYDPTSKPFTNDEAAADRNRLI